MIAQQILTIIRAKAARATTFEFEGSTLPEPSATLTVHDMNAWPPQYRLSHYEGAERARLLEKMAELVKEKRLEGIAELRDESDKDGMRMVIEIKRDHYPDVVLNNLYQHTQMQTVFGINMVALVDGQPRQPLQGSDLLGLQPPGPLIHGAEAAQGEAIAGDQREAGVEADVRLFQHQRVIAEARVLEGVLDDQWAALQDGVAAEGDIARCLLGIQADAALEPLPVFIHQ